MSSRPKPERVSAGTAKTAALTVDAHLLNLDRLGRSPKTVHTYRAYTKTTISPVIGTKRVRLLTALDLDNFYAQLGKVGRKPATIRQIHAISPARSARRSTGHGERQRRSVSLSPTGAPGEGQRPDRLPGPRHPRRRGRRDPILGRMVMLAALTGARRGGICALGWCDVDLEAGLLTIAHSILDLPAAWSSRTPRHTRSE